MLKYYKVNTDDKYWTDDKFWIISNLSCDIYAVLKSDLMELMVDAFGDMIQDINDNDDYIFDMD